MPSHETIDLSVGDGAATILLNRPDSLNAWNEQFGTDLLDAVRTVAGDEGVRAVMITGAGRAFSSGADLREDRSGEEGLPDLSKRLKELYHPIILGIREMEKPVLAAVNGPAVGIGCSLALDCDLILAAESSYFLLAFVNIGLVPDGGVTALLPARAGVARTTEMGILGERVPAAQALESGIVNRVLPDERLRDDARLLLEHLAHGPTRSYANFKKLINRRVYAGMVDQLEAEADAQAEQGRTADFVEGVLAFTEKRPPVFKGS
ncbi:MAG TPA: enoyl-CoA hydratase-related protein [Solirubrobacterales bacterium]|jgi:2-(1,2-epoxy-1,2-dihydrophenyl)acetyl-CoA isomerase|nr:enoyl-CoA hydratase-related protein [Solirubrobacterales bacterium]